MAESDVVILLGAGASVDAGLPTTEGMVDSLLADFKVRSELSLVHEPHRRLLAFVVHGLRQQAEVREDPVGLDVETMFDAIETLANRNQLSIAPFIASWDPLVAQAERMTGVYETPVRRLADRLNQAIRAGRSRNPGRGGVTSADLDFARELLTGGSEAEVAFHRLADEVLQALVRVLRISDREQVRYLGPLVETHHHQRHIDVGTLNYDLSVETLGDLRGVEVDTGVQSVDQQVRPVQFQRAFRLYKLHGSIDWQSVPQPHTHGDPYLLTDTVRRITAQGQDQLPRRPALIFGAGNKLRADGPYLELLRLFEERLVLHHALVIVGYSFRDEHVNAMLKNWINGDPTRRLVILDPAANRFRRMGQMTGRTTLGQRLAVLGAEHPDRVKLIAEPAATGLADAIRAARDGFGSEQVPA